MVHQRLIFEVFLIFINYYFSSCQNIVSPSVYESFNNKDGGNCTKDEPGFHTVSVVECLLYCSSKKGGKDALMENGTVCFCTECESPQEIINRQTKDTNTTSTITFYKNTKGEDYFFFQST